jgi:diguanylate cyclase (GGDEF)-like protein/PAS domain S-box-containing protein
MFQFDPASFRKAPEKQAAEPGQRGALHQSALQAAGVGTWRVELGTGRAHWDAVAAGLLGLDSGSSHEGAYPPILPQDRLTAGRALLQSARSGERREVEFRVAVPNGAIRWLRAIASPGGAGEATGWISGVLLDVTEKKLSELALSESQRRLSNLVDSLPGIAYRCEGAAPWRMHYISEGAEELTGRTVSELIAGTVAWAELMHPDDIPAVEQEVEAATRSGRQFSLTYRILHRSGAVRWVHERGKATLDDVGQLFFEGFIGDITDQKLLEAWLRQSEAEAQRNSERLRATLEGTMDCVYSLDREWKITYLNERARKLFGRRRDLLGKSISEILPGSSGSDFAECFRRVMNGGAAETIEGCLQPVGRWYEAHVTPSEEGITVFYRDISARKQAEAELKASRSKVQTILDSLPQVIWAAEPEGRVDYISNQWHDFGAVVDGSSGEAWLDAVHPDDREAAMRQWQASIASGQAYECEFRIRNQAGEYVWILARARPVRGENGEIARWYGTCTDVHQRVITQAALRESEAINKSIIDASPDCISMLDLDGNVLFLNQASFSVLQGATAASVLHKPWGRTFGPSVRGAAKHALACAKGGRIGHFTAHQPAPGDESKWWDVVVAPVRDADGVPTKLVVISRDITHQKSAEEKVRWTANHDVLTQLPNRAFLQQRLDQQIRDTNSGKSSFGVLLLDLDNFKRVNDTLGHDAGDALLCCFSDQLRAAARPDDFIARLGGDEFAVVLSGISSRAELESAVQAILGRLREPCLYGNKLLDCQASIGASLYPQHGRTRTELLKHADIALYVAKSSGRGGWKLFDAPMRAEMQEKVSMLSLARAALAKGSIQPYFQPKVDFSTGGLSGFEALLRWHDPRRGIQLPETIFAAFQDLELAAQISDRIVERVIREIVGWLDQGLPVGHVAINAAAAEFRRGNFAERLLEQLSRAQVPTSMLQVEVTETVFLGRGAEYVESALKTLSREGVEIALDDFGTGYASLSHLKQFPVDVLKIDRSFVRDFAEDPDDAAIVRAVINLGKSLGIKTVAEGVETEAQAAFLADQGCDFGQGFLYGRAIAASEMPALIRGWEESRAGRKLR